MSMGTQQFWCRFSIHIRFGGRDRRLQLLGFQARRFQRITYRTHLPRGVDIDSAIVSKVTTSSAPASSAASMMTSSSPFSKEMTFLLNRYATEPSVPSYPGFGERMAHFCNGTVTVVGQTFNHYRGAARTVTFHK